jgi:hypothetical protein
MALFTRLSLTTLLLAGLCGAEMCGDKASCLDVSSQAVQGSAMLQVQSSPADAKVSPASKACEFPPLESTHLKETSVCLPEGLQESHLQALRRNAALLVTKAKRESEEEEQQLVPSGADASLDAAGFKAVTSHCCPEETEAFFNRLLEKNGLQVCSKAHVQGLMHWFSCVPDMDFQYMLDIIANGNPCKYWAAIGATCAKLSPECEGKWCR